MKYKNIILFFLGAISILAASGCTRQAWYEGVKQGAENNCRKQPPGEVDRCLDNVNKKPFDEYEKERVPRTVK